MSEQLPKKHKELLYLYAKGPCDNCACTICEHDCDRISQETGEVISPCKRCDIPGARMLRKPMLACITFGGRVKESKKAPLINCSGKKVSSRGKIKRGIVPDEWEVK